MSTTTRHILIAKGMSPAVYAVSAKREEMEWVLGEREGERERALEGIVYI